MENNMQDGVQTEFPPLPETAAEESLTGDEPLSKGLSAASYATNVRYASPVEAAGAMAEAYLASCLGKKVMLRSTAHKKIIGSAILAVVIFAALALRMLYHRNNFIYYLIIGLSVFLAWRFLFRKSGRMALGKKLASMPDADMESVLMSESDQMAGAHTTHAICAGIIAAAAAAFLILFWNPHMIFEKTNGVVSLRFYTDSIVHETDVVIPDTWNDEPVTQIRGNVFQNIRWIKTVRLPDRLEIIRAHAFQGCSRLEEITFPATMQSIGSSAFRDCPALKTVTLPRDCSVDGRAFKNSGTTIIRDPGQE